MKGIPEDWVKRQKIEETDDEETVLRKTLLNHTLLNRNPYFFKYRYPQSRRKLADYEAQRQKSCKFHFGKTIAQLEALPRKTAEQRQWLDNYYEYAPLIMSDSPMNMLCKYIESVDFGIVSALKTRGEFDWSIYIDPDVEYADSYREIVECYKRNLKEISQITKELRATGEPETDYYQARIDSLREQLRFIEPDVIAVTNALVAYCYGEAESVRKTVLWDAYGRFIVESIKKHSGHYTFPMKDEHGEIEYMAERYTMKEVQF